MTIRETATGLSCMVEPLYGNLEVAGSHFVFVDSEQYF